MYVLYMNELYAIFVGPTSIWVLAFSFIYFATIGIRQILNQLKKTTAEVSTAASALKSITTELRVDTAKLGESNIELQRGTMALQDEMKETREEMRKSRDALQRMMWWVPK